MPATVRGKPSETGAKKDGAADPKRPLSGSKEQTRSTDSPKPSTARQRARDRRREKAAEPSPERTTPSPDAAAAAGRIKNLTGFWSTPKEEVQSVRKKRLEISEQKKDDSDSESESETDSDDSDERDEIKHAQESTVTTDRTDLVEIEKGRAKSIANIFQNRNEDDDAAKKKKTPFKLDIKSEEPTVFENEPVVLEGVARADDASTARDEILVGRAGRTKALAGNFAGTGSRPKSDDSTDSDDDQAQKTRKKKGEAEEGGVIERGKIQNVRQRWQKRQQKSAASSGRRGAEGTAKDSDADVSDSSDAETAAPPPPSSSKTKSDKAIEQKKVKNIRDRWTRRQDGGSEEKEDDKEKASEAKKAPAKAPLRPLDTAKEYGVFENEPVVREDVVRAEDDQPDVISCVRTKKLRRMWTNMEKEVTKDARNHPAETNVRVSKKKKEAKQEPEPEATTKTTTTTKSQKAIAGRYQEAAATEEKGKGKEQQRGGGGGGEGRGKLQKAFPVAAAAAAVAASPEDAAAKPSAPKSPSLARYSSSRKKNA